MEDVAVEASAIELQRGLLVARLMGVDPEWGRGPGTAPGWWLGSWAQRLASDELSPAMAELVLDWLERAATALADRDALAVPRGARGHATPEQQRWLMVAIHVREEGAQLEARVAAELTPSTAIRTDAGPS